MAKRFKLKLKLSRVIPPAFQICRSKHASADVKLSPQPLHRQSSVKTKRFDLCFPAAPAPPPSTPEDLSFIASHVSPAVHFRSCTKLMVAGYPDKDSSEFTWLKQSRWHVVSRGSKLGRANSSAKPKPPRQKVCCASSFSDSEDGDTTLARAKRRGGNNYRIKRANRTTTSRLAAGGETVSSSDENDGDVDEEDDDAWLLSTSRSFSNDSSADLDPLFHCKRTATRRSSLASKTSVRRLPGATTEAAAKRKVATPSRAAKPEEEEGGGGKVMRESVAVVKMSENPLEDFKRSMMEMIVEKKMFEAVDLEQLLQCFLSLNSRHYHAIIVEAFAEIWQVLFFDSARGAGASTAGTAD